MQNNIARFLSELSRPALFMVSLALVAAIGFESCILFSRFQRFQVSLVSTTTLDLVWTDRTDRTNGSYGSYGKNGRP